MARDRLEKEQRKILQEATKQSERESLVSPRERITLNAYGKSFYVHPPVLMAGSTFFKAYFNRRKLAQRDLNLRRINGMVMDVILDFLYTGSLEALDETDDDGVLYTLDAARYLGIELLYGYCSDLVVCKGGQNGILAEILQSARDNGYHGFDQRIMRYVARNLKSVTESSDIISTLTQPELCLVFNHPDFRASADTIVFCLLECAARLPVEEKVYMLCEIINQYGAQGVADKSLGQMVAWEKDQEVDCLWHVVLPYCAENLVTSHKPPTLSGPHLICFRKVKCKDKTILEDFMSMYNIQDACWTEPVKMPVYVDDGMAVVKCADRIYFLGGARQDRNCLVNTLFGYSPTLNAVTDVGTLVKPVYLGGAGVLQDKIYLLGGWTCKETGELVPSCIVQRYDPSNRLTVEITGCSVHPNVPFAVGIGEYLLVASLHDGTIQQFDSLLDGWTYMQKGFDGVCWGMAFLELDQKLYVLKQRIQEKPQEFAVYDKTEEKWRTLIIEDAPALLMPGLWTLPSLLLLRGCNYELYTFNPVNGEWDTLENSGSISDDVFCEGLYDVLW